MPPADNATFPYHNSSYTTFYIHALGYIYFSEAAALPLGTCTQHGHFFSADRIYAFCTGNGFVSNPSVSPQRLLHGIAYSPCSLTVYCSVLHHCTHQLWHLGGTTWFCVLGFGSRGSIESLAVPHHT